MARARGAGVPRDGPAGARVAAGPARAAAVGVAGALALAGGATAGLAVARDRLARDRERFGLLAALGEVADGRLTLDETAGRLGDLLVPAYADVCILDTMRGGELQRLAVRAAGPDAERVEARLAARQPSGGGQPGSGQVAASGRSQLVERLDERMLREAAHDPEDLALLRWLQLRSGIVVPLTSRGRTLGALTLLLIGPGRRRWHNHDVRFVEVLAGRVALALDNAGLFAELETIEAQLSAALGVLGEAVTIQNPQGSLIYANQAAADMMGFATPQELLARPREEIVGRWDYFAEDGSPLAPSEFPGRGALAGQPRPPLVMRAVDRRTGEQRGRRTTSSTIRDPHGQIRMVVNVIADITEVKRVELAQTLLASAGELLNRSLDLEETLQELAGLCVPALADWCTVRLPDEPGRILRTVAVAHTDPRQVELVRATRQEYPVQIGSDSATARVYATGEPVLVNQIEPEMLTETARSREHLALMERLRPRAALLVPLHNPGGPVGVLTLVSADSRRVFEAADVELAIELGRRAAHAVANARLYAERSWVARTLQESLLPETLPAVPGCHAAALYRPAGAGDRVGGDFYELFALEPDAWMLVVGDVTGRGAAAAALTGFLRHTLRAIATYTGSAIEALETVNRQLAERPVTAPCTAVVVVLRELRGEARAEIICAGHPLPLLIREGRAEYVGRFGPLLGVFGDAGWSAVTVELRPGDMLALYSDGVPDTRGAHDRFGPDRLEQTLAAATSAPGAVALIERALSEFHVGPGSDDTALLVLERLGVTERPAAPVVEAAPPTG